MLLRPAPPGGPVRFASVAHVLRVVVAPLVATRGVGPPSRACQRPRPPPSRSGACRNPSAQRSSRPLRHAAHRSGSMDSTAGRPLSRRPLFHQARSYPAHSDRAVGTGRPERPRARAVPPEFCSCGQTRPILGAHSAKQLSGARSESSGVGTQLDPDGPLLSAGRAPASPPQRPPRPPGRYPGCATTSASRRSGSARATRSAASSPATTPKR
jgi:hypothetical protein